MENEWKVGDWLEHKSTRLWRDEDGPRYDNAVIQAVITKIEGNIASWVMKKLVSVKKMNPHTELDQLIPKTGGFNTSMGHIDWIRKIDPPKPLPALWIQEFGEEYMVPAGISFLHGFEDSSWHNDTCPSFSAQEGKVVIWVDHPRAKKRELEGVNRYTVTVADEDGEEANVVYTGDDLEVTIATAKAKVAELPPTKPEDIPMRVFWHKILDVTQHEQPRAFSVQEMNGVEQMLQCYQEYREANGYQKIPIGLEGLEF